MMSYLEIFLMALVPGIGMAVSALVALWKRPSPTLTSIFQYFTAGVILAATVAELVPDLDIANYLWSVAIGFSIGVALMLLMRELFEAHEPQGLILDPSSAAVGSQGSGGGALWDDIRLPRLRRRGAAVPGRRGAAA